MTKIIYINSNGDSIEFSNTSPFLLQKKGGLGAVKNNLFTSKSQGQDGQTVTGKNLDSREITIQGSILADSRSQLEDLRRLLVTTLNPKLSGTLKYINESFEKIINCEIESAPVFGDETPLTQPFDVTILCTNPFWLDITESKEEIALWKGDFGFPLEIVDTGIELGHREPSLIVTVNNPGDVLCGMRIVFTALATVVNPSLFNVNTREYIKTNKIMQAGEVITITTHFANKRIESYLNGVISNVFNYIDLNSTFMQLDVGDNLFRYDADTGLDNLNACIYYIPQYLGV